MPLETQPRPPRTILLAAGVLVAVLGAYSPSIGGPFVWDDRMLIERAPADLQHGSVTRFFGQPFWARSANQAGDAVYYRPLTTISYALDWRASGGDPAWFHVTNVAWHLGVTALVFALALRGGAPPLAAALAALLFGVAPRLTESVAWISGRTDVLAGFFALLALLLYRDGPGHGAHRVGAAVSMLLGLLCKEVAVVALPALAAGAIARRRGRSWRPLGAELGPLVLALASYAALRLTALRSVLSSSAGLPWRDRLPAALEAVGRYSLMLVDPLRPRLQIGDLAHPAPLVIALGAFVTLAASTAAVVAARRRWPAPILEAVVLAAGALALVLHLAPLRVNVVAADRFLYVPVAGLAIALAVAAGSTPKTARRRAAALAALLAAASFGATYARAGEWADEERLWRVAVATTPESNALPQLELGNVLFRSRRYEDALREYREVSSRGTPDDRLVALANTASAQSELGDYDGARATLLEAIRREPEVPLNWYNLAVMDLRRLDFDAGERELARSLALLPEYGDAKALRARLAALRTEAASLPAETSLEDAAIRARRASLYARLGRDRDAARLYASLVDDPGASPAVLVRAARHLASRGDPGTASRALTTALGRGADPAEVAPLMKALDGSGPKREAQRSR